MRWHSLGRTAKRDRGERDRHPPHGQRRRRAAGQLPLTGVHRSIQDQNAWFEVAIEAAGPPGNLPAPESLEDHSPEVTTVTHVSVGVYQIATANGVNSAGADPGITVSTRNSINQHDNVAFHLAVFCQS